MSIDTGSSTDYCTSYERWPLSASLFTGPGQAGTWLDLPSHKPLWAAAFQWWNEGRPQGPLVAEGGTGCGKSHWLEELHHRLKPGRTLLAVAEFGPGERAGVDAIHRKWAQALASHVEPAPRWDSAQWVELALKTLATDGYRVLLAVEADQKPPRGLCSNAFIYLRRREFSQFTGQGLVLRPWSNDELAGVLESRWPGLIWPDETVERIWLEAVGRPRDAIALAQRLAGLAEAAGTVLVDAGWVGKNGPLDVFAENWAGQSGLI